jgi:hypothetical protein
MRWPHASLESVWQPRFPHPSFNNPADRRSSRPTEAKTLRQSLPKLVARSARCGDAEIRITDLKPEGKLASELKAIRGGYVTTAHLHCAPWLCYPHKVGKLGTATSKSQEKEWYPKYPIRRYGSGTGPVAFERTPPSRLSNTGRFAKSIREQRRLSLAVVSSGDSTGNRTI